MKVRKGQSLIIEFRKQSFPCVNGLVTFERRHGNLIFLTIRGQNVLLDLADHGTQYTLKENKDENIHSPR